MKNRIVTEIINLVKRNAPVGLAFTALILIWIALIGAGSLEAASDIKFALYILLPLSALGFTAWIIRSLLANKHRKKARLSPSRASPAMVRPAAKRGPGGRWLGGAHS